MIVTLTGSLSSPGAGWAWPPVLVALWGEMVRGEDALGMAMAGPAVRAAVLISTRNEPDQTDAGDHQRLLPGLMNPLGPSPPSSDPPTTSSSGKLMFSLDWLCCLSKKQPKQPLHTTSLSKLDIFNDSHKPNTHNPNSMLCSPEVEKNNNKIIKIKIALNNCVFAVSCVCDSRGFVWRLRIMNTSSSTVTMAANSIPPMAAPITAG